MTPPTPQPERLEDAPPREAVADALLAALELPHTSGFEWRRQSCSCGGRYKVEVRCTGKPCICGLKARKRSAIVAALEAWEASHV